MSHHDVCSTLFCVLRTLLLPFYSPFVTELLYIVFIDLYPELLSLLFFHSERKFRKLVTSTLTIRVGAFNAFTSVPHSKEGIVSNSIS